MALGNLAGRRAARRCTSRARSRRRRSGCAPSGCPARRCEVPVLAETDLDTVLATLEAERPEVVRDRLGADAARAGPHAARRAPSARCARSPTGSRGWPRQRGIAVLLVGHVTKEGALAGPRVLEHLVDCVLQFEGERERTYRTLRALKNRFGSTNEVGVFEMRDGGLVEVQDASRALRRRGHAGARAASCSPRWRARARCWSRSRRSSRPSELVPPRRVANGDRPQPPRAGAGRARPPRGHRRRQPPTCSSTSPAACGSTSRAPTWRSRSPSRAPRGACRWAPSRRRWRCFGEVGLTGELRSVAHPDRRLAEAREVRARTRASRPAHRDADAARRRCAAALGSAPTARAA